MFIFVGNSIPSPRDNFDSNDILMFSNHCKIRSQAGKNKSELDRRYLSTDENIRSIYRPHVNVFRYDYLFTYNSNQKKYFCFCWGILPEVRGRFKFADLAIGRTAKKHSA